MGPEGGGLRGSEGGGLTGPESGRLFRHQAGAAGIQLNRASPPSTSIVAPVT